MQVNESLLTTREAAALLSVSTQTVSDWAKEGKLEAVRIGRRIYTSREAIWRMSHPVSAAPVAVAHGHEAAMRELKRAGLA